MAEIDELNADAVIDMLGLAPHPEGGHYREIFHSDDATTIYFLLAAGERSHWHRIEQLEIWHHHAGAAMNLMISDDGRETDTLALGTNLVAGEQPCHVVPSGAWQAARPLGAWSLVGCTVAPAFSFDTFEMAPDGWAPGADR